ncbi:hypothetical protein DdX_01014 [Ditylenchus destructor]|uniref:Uncharacterized protein n=1 Tax=Ditylenchus destructor TaxID=166010 RepID=A0AAD4RDM1_9BILA|nr:hypothetical protein DdX_01014 [Ditylenchus destructor]
MAGKFRTSSFVLATAATIMVMFALSMQFNIVNAEAPICRVFDGNRAHCYCEYDFYYVSYCTAYCPDYCKGRDYNNHHCEGSMCHCGRFPCKRS